MLISQLLWILQGQKGPKFSYFLLILLIFLKSESKKRAHVQKLAISKKSTFFCPLIKKLGENNHFQDLHEDSTQNVDFLLMTNY